MDYKINRTRRHLPFRFLDLPKDIRLLCYENLPENITHHFTTTEDCTIAVSDKCFNPAILSTCRTIYNEAHDILFNALRHDGPQVSLAFRGSDIDSLLLILDHGLLPRLPHEERCMRTSKYGIGRHILERCMQFDANKFMLRSYMRTPKDHEVHINWQPTKQGFTEREYLSRFVKDMARLYCLMVNRPYTVSIKEGKMLVPLDDFLDRPIRGFSLPFQRRLALDGLTTWRAFLFRGAGTRKTSRWLWPREG